MTKTPGSAVPCPDVGDMIHTLHWPTPAAQQSRVVALRSAPPPPELLVTCEPCVAQNQRKNTSGLSCGSQADEDSLCSDSGFGGSPASSLGLSGCSSVGLSPSSSFEDEDEFNVNNEGKETPTQNDVEKNKNMVNWSPVVVPLNKRAPWVQVVGHAGNFQTSGDGKLLKKYCASEQQCLQDLMHDVLRPFVPSYHGVTRRDEQDYNLMDDLLSFFDSPCIMDCKMGSRTYLEEELKKARKHPQPRNDMYEKMVAVDPEAPTPEEKVQQAVLKTRYMQWRETLSSTATLGFRIEGIKKSDGSCNTNFKRTKYKEEVVQALDGFVDSSVLLLTRYQRRLKELRLELEKSDFFKTHELSSCLVSLAEGGGQLSAVCS
ncbi:inositol-trisphosphate 3-kinase C isoform X2 [Tachysurus fulvidraco]|uniref:inositol-trisphosphate 3-kinase C isoform X2 n=1 Tax=Tachysurus fulvidraco TaxID=1234273 RepID=UPI001FEE3A4D|nr:inositol-trisphosphate 3-kinase C isoform X2 [Tachysurus fulvidraco]